VIGHYDRKPALLDTAPLNVGIFHSGSGFNDDAFFELYGRVGAAIARAIPELREADPPRPGRAGAPVKPAPQRRSLRW